MEKPRLDWEQRRLEWLMAEEAEASLLGDRLEMGTRTTQVVPLRDIHELGMRQQMLIVLEALRQPRVHAFMVDVPLQGASRDEAIENLQEEISKVLADYGVQWKVRKVVAFRSSVLLLIQMEMAQSLTGRPADLVLAVSLGKEKKYCDTLVRMTSIMLYGSYAEPRWKTVFHAMEDRLLDMADVSFPDYQPLHLHIQEGPNHTTVQRYLRVEPLDWDLLQLSYPFIPRIREFLEKYLQSPTPILMFSGPPGTGKSWLLGMLLRHAYQQNPPFQVHLAFPGILERYLTEILQDSLEEEAFFLALDDAEFLLGNRMDEFNTLLNDLLYISGQGLPVSRIKLVFAHNQVVDPDEALLRPGRLFAEVQFRPLDRSEAEALVAYVMQDHAPEEQARVGKMLRDQQTLAEIWTWIRGEDTPSAMGQPFGFVKP
ncbi:MAG: ATP-binding protein [Candidatus Hydrothermae bacterium]|nr:ATP-binding protein [Candidatus Hydrothermae bacterium]